MYIDLQKIIGIYDGKTAIRVDRHGHRQTDRHIDRQTEREKDT